MTYSLNRRDALKQALVAGAAIAGASALSPLPGLDENFSAIYAPDAPPAPLRSCRANRDAPRR